MLVLSRQWNSFKPKISTDGSQLELFRKCLTPRKLIKLLSRYDFINKSTANNNSPLAVCSVQTRYLNDKYGKLRR